MTLAYTASAYPGLFTTEALEAPIVSLLNPLFSWAPAFLTVSCMGSEEYGRSLTTAIS